LNNVLNFSLFLTQSFRRWNTPPESYEPLRFFTFWSSNPHSLLKIWPENSPFGNQFILIWDVSVIQHYLTIA